MEDIEINDIDINTKLKFTSTYDIEFAAKEDGEKELFRNDPTSDPFRNEELEVFGN